MHELPVTQGILKIVLETAQKHGGGRITDISLVIGELASIVDDSVQFYFDFLSRDTLAQGARLHFRREPALVHCWACGQQCTVQPPLAAACPACGSARIQVSGGREFYVESIEMGE